MKKASWLFAAGAVGYLLLENGVFARLWEMARHRWEMEQRSRNFAERREMRRGKRGQQHRDSDGLLDVNHASRKELLALGLDHELAEKIIENRPFTSKMDLIGRRVIPDATYNDIRQRICAQYEPAA
jgi:hypothetical protein